MKQTDQKRAQCVIFQHTLRKETGRAETSSQTLDHDIGQFPSSLSLLLRIILILVTQRIPAACSPRTRSKNTTKHPRPM